MVRTVRSIKEEKEMLKQLSSKIRERNQKKGGVL
jgi:hypothetical protein